MAGQVWWAKGSKANSKEQITFVLKIDLLDLHLELDEPLEDFVLLVTPLDRSAFFMGPVKSKSESVLAVRLRLQARSKMKQ